MENEVITVSGIAEPRDFWFETLKNSLSFSSLVYSTVAFTVFGLFVGIFIDGKGEYLLPHFGGILVTAVVFALFQALLLSYWAFVAWKGIEKLRCEYQISKENLRLRTKHFRSTISLDYVVGFAEDSKLFKLLLIDPSTPVVIPKRFFSPEEIDKFRKIVSRETATATQV